MLIHALVASIRTSPEPTVLSVLDGIDEELADFVRGGLGIAMLARDNLPQFFC